MTGAQGIDHHEPATRPSRVGPHQSARRLLWPLAALVALLLFDLLFIPNFFRVGVAEGRLTGTLVEIFRWSGPQTLLAVGMTIVLATGGVDLSVGAVMALAGVTMAELVTGFHWTSWAAVLVGLGLSAAAGAWNGALVTLLDIQPIVATLVLMVGGRGVAERIGGAAHVNLSGPIAEIFGGTAMGVPTQGLVALGVLGLAVVFTRLTWTGLLIEATGGNPTASRYAGVNVKLVTFLAYMFCGLCAGLAGLLKTADLHGADASQLGLYWELDAILAAVIGGTALTGGRFSLLGAFLGAVLMVTLTTTIQSKVPVEYALIAKAIVVVAVCLLQSEAFRGRVLRVQAPI